MRTHEMRDLPTEELQARIQDTRREVVSLRFQLAARKLESPAKLRLARKNLSRLLTIQSEVAKKGGAPETPPKAKAEPKAKAAKAEPKKAAEPKATKEPKVAKEPKAKKEPKAAE